MRYRKLTKQTNVAKKRVLVRVSANVPLSKGNVSAHGSLRLEKLVPTLGHLSRKKSKTILVSHLGRPGGRRTPSLTMAPVAKRLSRILQKKVIFVRSVIGPQAIKAIAALKPGDIIFLENLRFYEGELRNRPAFAKKLAALGDVYVNEAFANSHRKHASIASVPLHIPGYAGFHFQNEVAVLEKVLRSPKKPLAVIVGGAKIASKLGVIAGLSSKAHVIMLGGDIANPLINPYRKKRLSKKGEAAAKLVRRYMRMHGSIMLPEDVVVERKRSVLTIPTSQLTAKDTIIDIGSESTKRLLSILQTTNTIVWNGPLGIFEQASGKRSSMAVARFLARTRATTIAGGGETVELITKLRLTKQYSFISTGGGAMLAFLSGDELPGIKVLEH